MTPLLKAKKCGYMPIHYIFHQLSKEKRMKNLFIIIIPFIIPVLLTKFTMEGLYEP